MYRPFRLSALTGLLALAAVGCNSGSSSPSTPALTDALADTLGEAIVSDINVSTAGATSTLNIQYTGCGQYTVTRT